MTEDDEAPRKRDAVLERETTLVDGVRWGAGGSERGGPRVVSTRRSIRASVLRLALMP